MIRKTVELEASSAQGVEEAVELALSRASVTLDGIQNLLVTRIAARVEDNRIIAWDVAVSVTFQLRDGLHD
ncbi:MAG TPA: dodecin family protein [Candidatus Dormibacteraeota bacterium]|nr:dodecin family protein [Candidatus Dormibacteraeota bacterium]